MEDSRKKGTPIPFCQKNLSHIKVLKNLPIKPDVMQTTGNPPSKVDSALKEGPARGHHLTRELEGTNKRLKFHQEQGTAFFQGG